MTEPPPKASVVPMVLIVEDDSAYSHSLGLLMRVWQFHYQAFGSAQALLDAPNLLTAQCLLVDICLPGMDGLDLQQHLNEQRMSIPFIAMSARSDVSVAVTATRHGAITFLEKPIRTPMLKQAIHSAIKASQVIADYRETQSQLKQRLALLTPRERQVLDCVVEGQSSAKIAMALELSVKTVTQHRAHLMQKLQAKGLVGLVRMVTAQPPPTVTAQRPSRIA